jgi:trigger factor
VDELRAKVRESLERAARRRYVEQRVQRAVQLLTEAAQVTVPEPLVDRQTDILYEDFLRNLRQQGIPLEAYQAATGQDEKAIRERLRPRAEERAKQNLVLEALALQEELLPGEGEIRAAAQELLGIGEKGPRRQERTLTRGQREYLRDVLLRQHAMELLQRLFGEAEAEEGEAQDLREGEPSQVSAEAASGGSSPDRAAQDA